MRTKLICALLALCLFCSGCSVMDLDTQNLMSPPKATGDKADIQRVIEESASSYTFKYPQRETTAPLLLCMTSMGMERMKPLPFINPTRRMAFRILR